MTSSYANLFGTTGAGQQGSRAGIGTMFGQQPNAGGGETEEERRRRTEQAGTSQTFAQMQQAGQARPAPTAAPGGQQGGQQGAIPMAGGGTTMFSSAPAAGGQQGGPPMKPGQAPNAAYQGFLGQLQTQLQQQFQQPSGYTTPQFQQLRQAQVGNLQAEFAGQRQALDEELARRGLSASSIGAGRMGDLAGQQARAMAGLEAQLLQQQAEASQRGRESALSTLANVTGQLGQQSIGEREADIRAQQMGQQNEQFYASLGAEEGRFARTLDEQREGRLQQLGVSTRELDLRAEQIRDDARLRGREISNTQARDEAEIGYRASALAQQLSMQGIQITADEARQRAQLDFQREQAASDEELRRLGFTVDRERLAQAETQFGRSFGFQEQQAQQNLAFQLAQIFSGSEDPMANAEGRILIQQMLQSNPIFMGRTAPPVTTPPAGGGAAGGGAAGGGAAGGAPAGGAPTGSPTRGDEAYSYGPMDFSSILRFGNTDYNPYDYSQGAY